MDENCLIMFCRMAENYSQRRSLGQHLTEDEALTYFQILNMVRAIARVAELNHAAAADQLERKPDDDEDYGAGSASQASPSPS